MCDPLQKTRVQGLYLYIPTRVFHPVPRTTISSESSTNILIYIETLSASGRHLHPVRTIGGIENRRIENHNFSFEFEKYIFCVLGQNHFQREKMKLQLLTCGLVFGQKVKPTFSPEQSIKRYTSIRNQYAGSFSMTFQFDLA